MSAFIGIDKYVAMEGVYGGEEGPLYLDETGAKPMLIAYNEGGYSATVTDLKALLNWVALNRPKLISDTLGDRPCDACDESIPIDQGGRLCLKHRAELVPVEDLLDLASRR